MLVQIPYLFGILAAGYLAEAISISGVLTFAGIAGTVVFLLGYVLRIIREAEILLPDPSQERS
jgi:energy-converting hydrogenase Eha subunit C